MKKLRIILRLLRNAALPLAAVCALCACAGRGPLPKVSLVEDRAFPSDVPDDFQAGGYALECEYGYYTGQRIDMCALKRTHRGEVRPNPSGEGKIHTRYALWRDMDLFAPPGEAWGYTFTIHTTDADVVTACSATQQPLGNLKK
ncbi:MAG: hypothetical protein LBQ10_12335 [Desulfovibrio sp.]|nr:hypothetical protein [Desulfovibrio sp.]